MTIVDEDKNDVLKATSIDEKSDWILDSSNAYHLCRDRKMFSTYAAVMIDLYEWQTTYRIELLAKE